MKKSASAGKVLGPHVSLLGAWALSFGCAVGWDSFLLPWTRFLPCAGPLGAVLGLAAAGAIAIVVAYNFHFMANRVPKGGGAYAYASEAFGADHGFLCAWFLAFAYISICWMDAAVLSYFLQHAWGFSGDWFGIRYEVAGYGVTLGHIVLSALATAVAAAICCRRRFAVRVQTAAALLLCAGILACFCAVAANHSGGLRTMGPAFAPGDRPVWRQILPVVAISPWLFIGFESIFQSSGEFRFPARRSFAVMSAAIAASVAAYSLLSLLPALGPSIATGKSTWTEAVAGLTAVSGRSSAEDVAFGTAGMAFRHGTLGLNAIFATFVAAVFTNLVGNTVAASRILATLADDGALPAWFGRRNRGGAPRNAIVVIALLSLPVFALGETVIGIVIDVALAAVCIIYAYVSAAAFKTARDERNRPAEVAGLFGAAVSVVLVLNYLWPNLVSDDGRLSAESCFVLVAWCVAGEFAFFLAFRRDRNHRFGSSPVAWNALFAVIILLTLMWVRKATNDITAAAVVEGRESVNRAIVSNSLVQAGVTVLSLFLSFGLFRVMRRREREFEREKAAAKNLFFSSVSHDIRTPLNAILGLSEVLKAGIEDKEERERALDSILVSGKTLLGLVNDVLDISKLESGKMEISPEPTDCAKLARGVLEAFRAAASKPGLELRGKTGEMPELALDPQRLRQIAFNLLGNSVKFTERGHIELRVSWTPPPDGAEAGLFLMEVEDTGCGISPEDLERLASPFVQVGDKRARHVGTGLGLAICKQLAKAMGGELRISSELGKGSVFSVAVPAVPAKEEKPEGKGSAAAHPPAVAARPRRLLLADDAPANLLVLKTLLKTRGDFDTETVPDGDAALAALRSAAAAGRPFDLVLTDLWMPKLDGTGLVRAMRDDPALSGTRTVLVTADVEMRDRFRDMGFDGLLLKPITVAALDSILSGAAE